MVKSKNKLSIKNKKQRGSGVSNSCVGNYAISNGGVKYNSNPQASSDLDDKTMLYGNSISLGNTIVGGSLENNNNSNDSDNNSNNSNSSSNSNNSNNEDDDDEDEDDDMMNGGGNISGGNKCGDEGVGTSNFKTETFKEYLEKLNSNFNINTSGGFNKMLNNKKNNKSYLRKNKTVSKKRLSSQKGSGYVVDPSQFIAGQPVYQQYDDCCPPAIIGGQMNFGAPDQAVCGFGAVKGGSRKRVNKFKKQSKRSKKSKTSKKSKKSKTHRKTKYQRGGDFTAIGNSKPADYSAAFNGPLSVFKYPDDMSTRIFDEMQPIWSPNAI